MIERRKLPAFGKREGVQEPVAQSENRISPAEHRALIRGINDPQGTLQVLLTTWEEFGDGLGSTEARHRDDERERARIFGAINARLTELGKKPIVRQEDIL